MTYTTGVARFSERGERPVVFYHACSSEQLVQILAIPGVARVDRDTYACTYDAAPHVAHILGVPCPETPNDASEEEITEYLASLPGLEAYRALGFPEKLRVYQKEGVTFLVRRPWALHAGPMRCIAGSSEVIYRRQKVSYREPIARLVARMNHDYGRWAASALPTTVSLVREPERYDEFGVSGGIHVRRNTIVQGHYAGLKEAWIVWTDAGSWLIASPDHRLKLAFGGFVRISDLRVGDPVLVRAPVGRYETRDGFLIHYNSAVQYERIAKKYRVDDCEMFDLTMKDPYPTYCANGFVVHNSGKSVQSLAAAVLMDAKKILIVAPAIAKYVWAEEVANWLDEEAVILEGRSGDQARIFCKTCRGRGRVDRRPCPSCRLRNGQSNGSRIVDTFLWSWDEHGDVLTHCAKHPEAQDSLRRPGYEVECTGCLAELDAAIRRSRIVVVNYDILVASRKKNAVGVKQHDSRLLGWAPVLSNYEFDLAILDECHLVRGWSSSETKKGISRREKTGQVVENIPTVWGLTGTPVFGFTRDLWGQLDLLSKGAMTGNGGRSNRLPFAFHAAYCEGRKDEYGWRADGRSERAETELKARLDFVKLQPDRKEILPDMPKKIRRYERLDPVGKVRRRRTAYDTTDASFAALLAETHETKIPALIENLTTLLAQEQKAIVYVFHRATVSRVAEALEAAINKADVRTRMRQVEVKIWATHGDHAPQQRHALTQAFRDWPKAGVFIATIDAVQVALSLKGASEVHFLDVHWQPAANLQAEDRPYEVGTRGLTITYYSVNGSADERLEEVVLSKVRTLSALLDDAEAQSIEDVMKAPTLSLAETMKELLAGVNLNLSAFSDDIGQHEDDDE